MKIKRIQPLIFLGLLVSQSLYADNKPLLLQKIEAAVPTEAEILKSKQTLQSKKKVELRDTISLPPFHRRAKNPIKTTQDMYCNGCHLPIPHSKSLRTRAFMNMHSEYIACESCHFKADGITFEYRWYDYAQKKVADQQKNRLHSSYVKKDKTKIIARTGRVKIAPFYQNKPVFMTQDNEFSKTLQQNWKQADLTEKAGLHAKIHQPLKTTGTECTDCHSGQKQSLFDFESLTTTPAQARAIQKNTIADFFKHYKTEKPLKAGELPPIEQRIKMIDILN